MTPTERRNYLSIQYFLKIKASLHNPTNKCITNRNETLFRNHQEAPFFIRVANLLSTYNFTNFNIKPDFSYLIPGLVVFSVFSEKTKKPGFFTKNWKNREKTMKKPINFGFYWF